MSGPSTWAWPRVRTILLFVGGMVGIAHQELTTEKPTLIVLYAGMMGLGKLLEKDEKNKAETPPPKPEAGP